MDGCAYKCIMYREASRDDRAWREEELWSHPHNHSPNVGVMLGRRRRRWANITATLGQCFIRQRSEAKYGVHKLAVNHGVVNGRQTGQAVKCRDKL